MANGGVKADRKVRDELYKAFEAMVKKAMMPGIPIPQRQALHNRAQELRAQWLELESARFNKDAEKFQGAQLKLAETIADLHKAIQEIDDAIKIAERASKVFAQVDKLLKVAIKHLPIPL